jgi:catechol 2,3-dioxygenase-like lactoylglutathione lyase family enzyme
MIKTLGLTHIALGVTDVNRAAEFYQEVSGAKEMYRHRDFIQVQTPSSKDIIVFEKQKKASPAVKNGFPFVFRLTRPSGIKTLVKTVKDAGGKFRESGELVPGEAYVFFYDPDGYEAEVWFEKIPASLRSFI